MATGKAAGSEIVNLRPATVDEALALYGDMVRLVPDAEDGNGDEIWAAVLMATDPTQIGGDQSKLPDAEAMVGRRLRIDQVTKRVSELEGKDFYLIVDAVDTDTGDILKFQTSAGTPMAAFVKLCLEQWLPALVTITRKEKATRAGFHPLGIVVHGAGRRQVGA